ncbi:TIR domain-containing protein [soil metagenome]
MALQLKAYTRHRCFISYHHDDEHEVQEFIREFDHDGDVMISRGIGASMAGDVIDSNDDDYIKSRIRLLYLRDSTVTIVMIGRCTWARRFVDWEVAASLRNTSTTNRNGLMAITLPSVAGYAGRQLSARVADNVDGKAGYARWWKYPSGVPDLANLIEGAFQARADRAHLVDNSRTLIGSNYRCP